MSFRLPYGMTDTSNRDDWMYKSNTTHTHTFGTVGRLTWPIFLFCHSTHKTFKCPFICVCMCMWRQCVWSAAIWINYIGNTNDTNISTIRTMQSIHYQIDVSRQCLEKCYLPKKKTKNKHTNKLKHISIAYGNTVTQITTFYNVIISFDSFLSVSHALAGCECNSNFETHILWNWKFFRHILVKSDDKTTSIGCLQPTSNGRGMPMSRRP